VDQQLSDLSIVEGGTLNFLPLVAVSRVGPDSAMGPAIETMGGSLLGGLPCVQNSRRL